ncbi:hypothetical protein ACFL35_10050 [Candidatus Riflebacteria bacterium]
MKNKKQNSSNKSQIEDYRLTAEKKAVVFEIIKSKGFNKKDFIEKEIPKLTQSAGESEGRQCKISALEHKVSKELFHFHLEKESWQESLESFSEWLNESLPHKKENDLYQPGTLPPRQRNQGQSWVNKAEKCWDDFFDLCKRRPSLGLLFGLLFFAWIVWSIFTRYGSMEKRGKKQRF